MKSKRKQNETENHLNKRNNNNKETKTNFDANSIEYQLSLLLQNLIKSHNPKAISPDLNSWSKEIDIMISKDGRNYEDIGEAIFFSQESEFWKNIVKNPKNLRQNFETILKQMNEEKI